MEVNKPFKKSSQPAFIARGIDQFFLTIYDVWKFVMQFFKELLPPPYEFKEMIRQCYFIGYKSIPLITVTGFITGVVFTNQIRPSLVEFGATAWLPAMVAIAIIRALAPLVTAIISAGRVGSSIGAELGSMRVTEQIDAMEVSAVNPYKFLVVSRVLATTITIPVLTVYFAFVCMFGAYFDVQRGEFTSFNLFVQNFFEKISFFDYMASFIRSIIFGFTIGMVGCYKGYNTTMGTEGVGRAANTAVVTCMFLLFIEEMLIVAAVSFIHSL